MAQLERDWLGCGEHPERVAAYKFQAPEFMSVSQPKILAPDWGHMSTDRQDLFTMDADVATGLAKWERIASGDTYLRQLSR